MRDELVRWVALGARGRRNPFDLAAWKLVFSKEQPNANQSAHAENIAGFCYSLY